MADSRGPLPPGWEEKYDPRTAKSYYINHATRETTWEDPRQRYPVQPAASNAQFPSSNVQFPARKQEFVQMQDLGRNRSVSPQPRQHETTTTLSQDSGVLSQCLKERKPVELYGLTQAELNGKKGFLVDFDSEKGRWKVAVEGKSFLIQPNNIKPAATSTRSSPVREQVTAPSKSSQQMAKARQAGQVQYLKSMFPTASEHLLGDVMTNSENDIMKAVEKLTIMGYVTKEEQVAPKPKVQIKTVEEQRPSTSASQESRQTRTTTPESATSSKSDKEKENLRKKVKQAYGSKFDIPERILYMALESALYDEKQANELIKTMIEDDLKRKLVQNAKDVEKLKKAKKTAASKPKPSSAKRNVVKEADENNATEISTPRISRGMKRKEEEETTSFRSIAKGPNPDLRKGPNDELLITSYISWSGPNPDIRNGPNRSLVEGPQGYESTGSRNLAKGAAGLAKGSITMGLEGEGQNRSS